METKTIKRFSIGMMLITFTLMLCAAFGLPQSVFAASQSYSDKVGETISLTQPTNYEVVNGEIELPTASFASGTLRIVAVTNNATQEEIEVEEGTETSPCTRSLPLVEEVSSYTVTYILTATNGVETKSTINVDIDLTQPVFEWAINTSKIIPAKVKKVTSGSYAQVALPMPIVKDIDGNELEGDVAVDIFNPEQESVKSQISNGVWTAVAGNNVGTYTVVYTYKSTTSYTKTQSFTFTLTDEDIEVNLQISDWKDSKSLPTSMALYVESELPQPVVVNTKASSAEVQVYTLIYLKSVPNDSTIRSTIYTNDKSKQNQAGYTYEESLDNFKFTPTVAGKYTITYVVTDFFGNTAEQSSDVNAITVSKTKASGQGFIVPKYAVSELETMINNMNDGIFETAEDKIPSYVYTGYKFDFPALFGYDEAYGLESLERLSYQIVISYTEPGKTSQTRLSYSSEIPKTETNNRHLDPTDPTTNSDLKNFEFKYAVDYTIKYTITDEQSNYLFENTYTVKVAETKPTTEVSVNMSGLNTIVKYGDTLKFTVTASSKLSSDTSVTADERPTVLVNYKVGTMTVPTVIPLHNDGYYYLELTGAEFIAGDVELTITATATDDLGVEKPATKKITVQNIQADTQAPIVTDAGIKFDDSWGNGIIMNTITAGDTLKLPIVVFDDESTFQVSAKVECNGKVLSTGVWGVRGENQFVAIGGQSFIASKVGTYVVTYEAEDLAGNKTTKCFTFEVVGEEIPILHVDSFNSSYEYGDEIDISNISVTINGEEVDSSYYSNIITNIPKDNAKVVGLITAFLAETDYTDPDTEILYDYTQYNIKGSILCLIEGNVAVIDAQDLKTIIRAGQEGSITLTYWAVSENGDFNAEPTSVTFSVSDTKGPIVTLNAEKITNAADPGDETVNIYIPDATSKDYISNAHCDVTITAKYKSDTSNLEIVKDNSKAGYYGYVVASKVGVIEVTYASKDNMGNEAQYLTEDETESLTYTISVGDVSAPIISTTALQEAIDKQNYKYGSEVTLDLSKISITKDLTYESENFTYAVTCGTETVEATLDGEMLSFKADSYGEYVVTFNVEDSSGIAAEAKTVSFTISKESSESTTSTTIWGTILIIAVLIVLGVVIFLFAKPTKSKAKIKAADANKKDEKKDNKNDKIEV